MGFVFGNVLVWLVVVLLWIFKFIIVISWFVLGVFCYGKFFNFYRNEFKYEENVYNSV